MNVLPAQYRNLLVTYLRPVWPRVLLLAIFLLINISLQLINPQLLRNFIDTARGGGALSALVNIALLFIGVALVNQVFYALASYLSVDVGWSATNLLRADLILHCLRLDMSFHNTHLPGEMIERIDGDVTMLSNFFSQFVIRVLGSGLLLLGILALVFREDWRLGLMLAGFVAVTLITVKSLQGIGVPYFKTFRQLFSEVSGFWEERLLGIEDIRTSGAKAYVMQQHYRLMRRLMQAVRKAFVIARVVIGAWEVIGAIGNAALFTLAAYLLNRDTITIGAIYLVFHYTELLSANLYQITRQIEDLQRAAAGVGRISELYYAPHKIPDGEKALPSGALSVEFQDVSFAYSHSHPVLEKISFHLEPGTVLGLLGRTGGGKTTLTRLLFRFYDVVEGDIRLAGTGIRQLRLDHLRKRIGFVTQDVQLFHATVRDNLTFFDKRIGDEQILRAIDELGLRKWFSALPEGLDTMIAPGGSNLSAGEAQLLALTRLFLKDPGLVILDEAASRLDPVTEALIGRAVERLLQGRTGIIIAHRLKTVERVDKIMILQEGVVREYGDYESLALNPDSYFSTLLQTGLEKSLA